MISFILCIVQDAQHADIDHMEERKTFTLDRLNFGDMPDYFTEIGQKGIKNIVILVGYDTGTYYVY